MPRAIVTAADLKNNKTNNQTKKSERLQDLKNNNNSKKKQSKKVKAKQFQSCKEFSKFKVKDFANGLLDSSL